MLISHYAFVFQYINPETYSIPTYLLWHFSYFMTMSPVKTGHISQGLFLAQIILFLWLGHMALNSEIEIAWSTGGCKLLFTPVWIWFSSTPKWRTQQRANKISRTSSSTWKLQVIKHHPVNIIQLKTSFSLLSLSSYSFQIHKAFS